MPSGVYKRSQEHRKNIGRVMKKVMSNPTIREKIRKINKVLFSQEKNPRWKGEGVGYEALHVWVNRHKGKPNKCEHCGTEEKRKYEWANKSHKYKRDLDDWIRLCVPCHKKYDRKTNCKRGHEFTDDNIYWNKGNRHCRRCRNGGELRRVRKILKICHRGHNRIEVRPNKWDCPKCKLITQRARRSIANKT